MKKHFFKITLNFLAIILLLAAITAPFYFAKNLAQVAGVNTESTYLIVPQVEKFPNLKYSASGNSLEIKLSKQAISQAYLSAAVLTNPSDQDKTYSVFNKRGEPTIFFGEDLQNQITKVRVPPKLSIPISILSQEGQDQVVSFSLETK